MNNRRFVETIIKSAVNYPEITFSMKKRIYTCVNPFSYHLVRKNQDIYNKMSGLYVDGILMCKMINLLWRSNVPRLSFDMSGMAVDLFELLNKDGNEGTIYFIGAKQDDLEKTISIIQNAYPKMNIAGYRNGYFVLQKDREEEINNIVLQNPDFVVIGMGSPLQEQFCIDLQDAGYKGIAFTCGGFLHQTTTGINYYPKWINKYNLRAFYRLYHEKGLWGRLYNVLIQFPILFIWDTICAKINMSKS